MKKRGSIIPGLLLVMFGVFLLLERLDLYLLKWSLIVPLIGFIGGILMWSRSITTPDKGSVFPGTLLAVLGGFFFLWNYGVFYRFWNLEFWPIFPTALGLAFLSLMLVNWRNWWAIFPSLPLLGVGLTAFAIYFDIVDKYAVEDFFYHIEDRWYIVKDFYPIIFVVIGLLIVLSSVRRSKRRNDSQIQFPE